ncbi:tripartite motif-containing protein 45 [Silurus meridionalis]|uniref:RING-type E3 ubiquitin transferase n=2 Tax=Silurus meridionalis TaxID=175797 RepID=A0A8T0BSF8_SILME|nr:hypothetical protein HF521_016203 [Silurus meridionalis]KAI5106984.1 tripartite motif-containing protein 45 [Silurus meridionalis]
MSASVKKAAHEEVKDIGTDTESNGNVSSSRAFCRVCKRMYREPKLLSCLHTFCADCIRQLEAFSPLSEAPARDRDRVRERVLCPECDSVVELPRSGVDALTTDHLALDEVFMETLLLEKCAVCDLCGDAEARQRCAVCSLNLCDFCSQAHRRQKRTSSHAIQSLEELKRQGHLSRPVLCSQHPGQELRLFCETCDLTICMECAAAFHKDHRCSPLHEVIHQHGDRIRELVSRNLRPRLFRLEEALRCVQVSQNALQSRAEAMSNEIQAFAQAYTNAVQTHCRSLLHSLEDLRLQRRNQLQLQKVQLQQALCDIRGSVDFAERLLTCGSEAEILSVKGVTTRRLMSLIELGYDPHLTSVSHDIGGSICFLPQELAGDVDGFPMVGVLQAKTVDPSKCSIQGEGVQQCIEGQKREFTLVCRDSAGELMAKGGDSVLVSIIHTEKKECKVETAVIDNNDGSYTVSYTPREPGSYSVWVCVKAQHVKGSPFGLTVKRKIQRHRGIFHCCSFCSSGGAKEARCGCPGTMPGGFQGCGHGHKDHPGKPHWSCCGSVKESSECLRSLESGSQQGHVRTVEL